MSIQIKLFLILLLILIAFFIYYVLGFILPYVLLTMESTNIEYTLLICYFWFLSLILFVFIIP